MLRRAAPYLRKAGSTDSQAAQRRFFAQEGSSLKDIPQNEAKGSASAQTKEPHMKGNSRGQLTLVGFGVLCVASVAWMASGKTSQQDVLAAGDKKPDSPYPAASR